MNNQAKIQQCEAEIVVLQKTLEELKTASVPEKVKIFHEAVTVGIVGPYIVVYGKNIQDKDATTKGYPITCDEARKMIDALKTMIEYQEGK